jgi:hypothetical protein
MAKAYKEPILTTYSDIWITGTQHRQASNKRTVVYKPSEMIISYSNKHMGICTDIIKIDVECTPKEIMERLTAYATKNVVNLSVINAEYLVTDGEVDFSKPLKRSSSHCMPVFSKKGTNLVQIDVNFLAILNIGNMWDLQEKWMSASFGYGGDWEARKTHADLFAPDSYLRKATHWTYDNHAAQYLSPLRPSLMQLEIENC